jgi:hypothetical protein
LQHYWPDNSQWQCTVSNTKSKGVTENNTQFVCTFSQVRNKMSKNAAVNFKRTFQCPQRKSKFNKLLEMWNIFKKFFKELSTIVLGVITSKMNEIF